MAAGALQGERRVMAVRSEEQIIRGWGGAQRPLVSIVCPTYNHEKYIGDAIEGFLLQETSFPFEIIIHEDASTDGTAAIVRRYQERYPRLFRPIYQTDNQYRKKGKTATTTGIALALGRYVALCEGDDYWTDPTKLSLQVEFLESHPEYSMYAHSVDVRNDTVDCAPYVPYCPITKPVNGFEDILHAHFIPTLSLVFRKSFWPEPMPEFFFDCRSRDIAFELMLATKGPCYFLDRKMGTYRHHDGGITKTQYGVLRDREFLLTLYCGLLDHLGGRFARPLKRKIAWIDYVTGRAISGQPGQRMQELTLYLRALAADPLVPFRVRAWHRTLTRGCRAQATV